MDIKFRVVHKSLQNSAKSIMGWKIDFPEFFRNGTICYCLFCEVNDNKQLFWFYHKNIFFGMVQAGMTHQAVADHFNVSKITIPRLMIRLPQTGRTNDKTP
jgi:hypothetical protein